MDSKASGGIDLHVHSNASDGSFTPAELLSKARATGLRVLAITDHDTLEGARIARSVAGSPDLSLLTGVEISTQAPPGFDAGGSLHILGYGIDLDDKPLLAALDELKQARDRRTPRIVEQLNRAGIPLRLEQVEAEVGQGTAGRPHIAKALIKMGVVNSVDEAFDAYLAKGRAGYVEKYRIDCHRALTLIREAGGVPVLAHPFLIRPCPGHGVAELVKTLCQKGLAGIEAYYPKHTPDFTEALLNLARQHDLIVTGGTDFHGDLTPGIEMGSGYGDLFVPYRIYEALVSAVETIRHKVRSGLEIEPHTL